MSESHPRLLNSAEVRFDLKLAINRVPKALWRDLKLKDDEKSRRALALIIVYIVEHFERYQIYSLPPNEAPGSPPSYRGER